MSFRVCSGLWLSVEHFLKNATISGKGNFKRGPVVNLTQRAKDGKRDCQTGFLHFYKYILTFISVLISIVEGHRIGHRLTPKNNIYTALPYLTTVKTFV